MRPSPKDPPRLLVSGSEMERNLSIECYVDTEPFFSSTDAVKSLILLFGAYFVLNIKWPSHTRLPLLLLGTAMFGPEKFAKDVSKNGKLAELMQSMKLI